MDYPHRGNPYTIVVRSFIPTVGCGDGEHGFEGGYFVENGLALDVPTGDGSFDSQSICPFLTEKRKMRECSRISGRRLQPLLKLACSGSIDEAVERVDKFLVLVWLDDVGASTELQGTLLVFGGSTRSEDDQWQSAILLLRSHSGDELVAVHTRHLDVEQDSGWRFVRDQVKGLNAVTSHLHFPTVLC